MSKEMIKIYKNVERRQKEMKLFFENCRTELNQLKENISQ